jgi:hypothetical protein
MKETLFEISVLTRATRRNIPEDTILQLMQEVHLPDDTESPTVVLDRVDATPSPVQTLQHLGAIVPPITVAEGVVTPDPFRDVIRTEPAPDLPSLIEDMMPYFLERHSSTGTTPVSSTVSKPLTTFTQERKTTSAPITFTHMSTPTNENGPMTPDFLEEHNNNRGQFDEQISHGLDVDDGLNTEEDKDDSGISLDSVLQFLFSDDDSTRSPSRTTHKTTSYHLSSSTSTSQGTIAMSHNTPATDSSQNSSEGDDKNQSENTTGRQTTASHNEDVHNLTIHSTGTGTKFSTVPHAVLTTVLNGANPTASSREPPPGKHPNLQHPPLRAPVSADPVAASGLLKLAGCNIYGRMYRVGRIISELSGPCLECMCTEVGVQCRPLDC